MMKKNDLILTPHTGNYLRKPYPYRSKTDFRIFTLIGLALFVLNSCDLFGQDDGPKPKSTEFVFTIDTLKQFSQFEVNDLDVIDDTSFVITGFFVESNTDGSTKNVYNQIWWGKKKGYEFRAMPQLHSDNSIITTSRIYYFAGNATYHVYGGSSRYSIYENGGYKHQRLQDGDGFFTFDNIELIRPGEFYLFGRNGSLAYYKDGTFTKIDAGTDMNFYCAGYNGKQTLLYGRYPPLHPKYNRDSLSQILIVLEGTQLIEEQRLTYALTDTNPTNIRTIYWQDNYWLLGSGSGIFSLTYPFSAQKIRNLWLDALYDDGEGNFIAKDLRDRNWYLLENSEVQLPYLHKNDLQLKSDYHGRLFIESFGHEVSIGTYYLNIHIGIQQ